MALLRRGDGARLGSVLTAAFGVAWMLSVCGGLVVLLRYENRAGVAATPPDRWPTASQLGPPSGRPTLVMLAHPACPCSRASIEELDRLMARVQGLVTAHVLFVKPRNFPQGWEETDLWRHAASIPGVRVTADEDGVEANLFGAATSGQVVLYDANGALLFSGGITASRGHAGDSPGRQAIIELLTGTGVRPGAHSAVFGCSLHDPSSDETSAHMNDGA